MSAHPRPLPVLLLLLLPGALAGCFGGDDSPGEEAPQAVANESATTAQLPDGRGQSAGNLETNKTEEGVGGVEHKHDYWQGQEQVVLFQDDVTLSFIPLFPDGEGSTPKGVAYVKLPSDRQVFEGTEKVTVLVGAPTLRGAEIPNPPQVTLQYRSAADADWREPVPIAYGAALEIPVEPKETDMPHSTFSLWVFRITSDRPAVAASGVVNVTVTAHKGREVVDWPGHPDFYGDKAYRVVLDKDVTTHIRGFPENVFYEGNDWAVPDLLISHGTARVEVWTNITSAKATSPTVADPVSFYLNMHNATQVGFENDIFNWFDDADGRNDLASYHFVVPVSDVGMDGPYQPASRWGFRLEAGYGASAVKDVVPFGGCGDCASYDIDYHVTVIAYPPAEEAPAAPAA